MSVLALIVTINQYLHHNCHVSWVAFFEVGPPSWWRKCEVGLSWERRSHFYLNCKSCPLENQERPIWSNSDPEVSRHLEQRGRGLIPQWAEPETRIRRKRSISSFNVGRHYWLPAERKDFFEVFWKCTHGAVNMSNHTVAVALVKMKR